MLIEAAWSHPHCHMHGTLGASRVADALSVSEFLVGTFTPNYMTEQVNLMSCRRVNLCGQGHCRWAHNHPHLEAWGQETKLVGGI